MGDGVVLGRVKILTESAERACRKEEHVPTLLFRSEAGSRFELGFDPRLRGGQGHDLGSRRNPPDKPVDGE